ncbi:MAG: replication initiator protein A [Acidobacteriia bacterium]|nr:replication initiator protein A [Terriglobia bacterium]
MNQEAETKATSEEFQKKLLRFPLPLGREPIDLAEWPVVTLAHVPIRDRLVIENVLGADADGSGIPQGWELALRNLAVGAPIAGDQDIYVAIMAFLHETDFNVNERVLRITRADICRVLDWQPNLKRYLRIQDALSRFRNVTYKGRNIFKDPETGQRYGYIEFGFIDSFGFSDRPPKRKKGARQPELPLSYVRIADEFLILCRHANLKLIDLDFYRSLSRPETRWLYRFLDKNLYKRTEYRIGLWKLRRKQGLLANRDPKYIKRDHEPRLEELKGKGFLRDWRFEKSSDPEDRWQLWVAKDPAFGLRRLARRSYGPTPQGAPKRAAGERIGPPEGHQEAGAPEADLVAYFESTFHGVAGVPASKSELGKAADLLRRCDGDVARARFCIDWTRKEAERTNFLIQNFGGLLSNNYPERALSDVKRCEQGRADAAAEERVRLIHARYQNWKNAEIEARWNALSPEDQERRVGIATAELRKSQGDRLSYWQKDAVARHAHHSAKLQLAEGLCSFEDWRAKNLDQDDVGASTEAPQ